MGKNEVNGIVSRRFVYTRFFSRGSSSVSLVNVTNVYFFKSKPSEDWENVKYLEEFCDVNSPF